MTTTDEPIAALEFNPYIGLPLTDIMAALSAESVRRLGFKRQKQIVWGTKAADYDWCLERHRFLCAAIIGCDQIIEQLFEARTEALKVKPTDVPQPWGGAV